MDLIPKQIHQEWNYNLEIHHKLFSHSRRLANMEDWQRLQSVDWAGSLDQFYKQSFTSRGDLHFTKSEAILLSKSNWA